MIGDEIATYFNQIYNDLELPHRRNGMREKIIFVSLLCLTVLLTFCNETPLQAQYYSGVCGPPASIITSDGTELKLTYLEGTTRSVSMKSVKIVGDGFCVSISFDLEDEHHSASIAINNSDDIYDWGSDVLEISNGDGSSPRDEIIDITCLPQEYAELWTRLQAICGELVESDEFWELIDLENEKDRSSLREDLENLRDGCFIPYVRNKLLSIQLSIGCQYICDCQMGRGYTFYGPTSLQVITSDAPDDENPDIFLGISAFMIEDCWTIHIDPVAEVCTISWRVGDPTQPLSEDEWLPVVEEFRDALEFYFRQIPLLIEGGILEPDSELEFLLEKSLHGLEAYRYELGYTNTWGDTIL